MSETRKPAAILVADIVGYSRLAGADEDRILARPRTLRSETGVESFKRTGPYVDADVGIEQSGGSN
jgi:class 3 adenylate cyclase